MRKLQGLFGVGLAAGLGLVGCGPAPVATDPRLVWGDEFSGSSLDTTHWGYQLGNGDVVNLPGWGNNELEYYTSRPENVSVKDGNLVLTARRESYTGDQATGGSAKTYDWTSGRIRTAGKFSRTFGKIEIRAKLPVGKGLWPAFWLLPEDTPSNTYGTWAANGEIDVTEVKGAQPDKLFQTLHYGGQWPSNTSSGNEYTFPNAGTVDQWHTYALEWRNGEIKWLVDGVVTSTRAAWWSSKAAPPKADSDLAAWPAPFDKPFYVLLNLAVGGNFGGNPDASTPASNQMLVDYVRWTSLDDENRSAGERPAMTYPWTPSTTAARPAQADGNLIYNPSFDWDASNSTVAAYPQATTLPGVTNSAFWTVFQANQGEAFTLSNDAAAGHSLKTDITAPGSVNYAVQVRQDGLNIVNQKRYQVDFDAWASTARHIMVKVGGGDTRSFAAYSGEQDVALGTAANGHHSFTFDMAGATDTAARMEFNLGAGGTGPVWIDNVVVKQIGDAPAVVTRPPLPDGNLLYNTDFTLDDAAHPGITGVPKTSYWSTWEDGTSGLSTTVSGKEIDLAVAHVNPANNWHVQLNQVGVPLVSGKSYTLSFTARSTSPRTVAVVVGENGGSYARYLDQTAALTATAQPFTYTFTASATNPLAQLQILGAVGTAGDAYHLTFSDFRLVQN